jgi:hypothetical protein
MHDVVWRHQRGGIGNEAQLVTVAIHVACLSDVQSPTHRSSLIASQTLKVSPAVPMVLVHAV